jgi:hypothetical protein
VATFTPEGSSDFILRNYMTVGSELTVNGVANTTDGLTQTYFKQNSKKSAMSDNNAVCFMIEPKPGIAFTPTHISFKASRWVTDDCKMDAYWINDDNTTKTLMTGHKPNRDGSDATVSTYSFDLTGNKAAETTDADSAELVYDETNANMNYGEEETATQRNGWGWGSFVGMGSMILGIILILMPKTFVEFLVYIISAFLIIGAIQQFVTLGVARKNGSVGFGYWIMPVLLFIAGCIALFKPTVFASAPLFFIGWFLICYGIVECINALKARSNRKKFEKEQNFYNLNQKPDFSNAEEVEAEEVE